MENNNNPILTMESFKVAVSDIDRVYKDTFYILKATYDKAKEEMNKSNELLTDVYHIIELGNISWWGRIKIMKVLIKALHRRREAKNMYTMAQCMFDNYKKLNCSSANINMLGTFINKENTLEARSYSFRVLDIKPIVKGEDFKIDSSFDKEVQRQWGR